MIKPSAVVVWFKRDLRVHDHAPLFLASQTGLPVLPLYMVEPNYWLEPYASQRHWQFIHDCLQELRQACATLGQPLIIRVGDAIDTLKSLQEAVEIKTIYAHEENGNQWTYARDLAVVKWCGANRVVLHEVPSNGVVRRLKKRDDWSAIRQARLQEPMIKKPTHLIGLPQIEIGALPSK